MIWLIKCLVFGQCCPHTYETFASGDIVDDDGDYIARAYHCRCTKCGALKKFKL
jgi:hypothetical protein